MRAKVAAALFCALLFGIGVAPAAHAEPSATDKATARKLVDKGKAEEARNDLMAAETSYTAAHQIMHVPTTALHVAEVKAKKTHLVEAREWALEATRLPVLPNELPVQPAARKDAAALAEALSARIPSVQLAVSPNASDITVAIDGVALPPGGWSVPRDVNPGPHSVIVRASGFAESVSEVQLKEGERRTLNVTLQPLAPVQAQLPATAPALPRRQRTPVWMIALTAGGFGLGGALGITAGVTGGIVMGRSGDLQDRCPNDRCPASVADDLSETAALAHVSTGTLIGAGVFATLGTVGAVLLGTRGSERPARVRPTASGLEIVF